MTTTASLPVARREQVREGRTPRDERYVSLSTVRLLATDVYVVAVIDGTGRLTDPASLLTTPLLDKARKHANALFESWGGGVPEAPPAAYLERKYQRPRDFPDQRRTFHRVGNIVELHEPKQDRTGKWIVRWYVEESIRNRPRRRPFPTEQEARAFHAELTELRRGR